MVINKKMCIKQVMDMDRNAAPIFMQFGMHCLFCPHSTGETLEQAAMVHGNDVDTLVEQLNEVYLSK